MSIIIFVACALPAFDARFHFGAAVVQRKKVIINIFTKRK